MILIVREQLEGFPPNMKCEKKDLKDLKGFRKLYGWNAELCKNHGNFLSFILKISV